MPERLVVLLETDDLGWAQLRASVGELPDVRVIEVTRARQALATAGQHPVVAQGDQNSL